MNVMPSTIDGDFFNSVDELKKALRIEMQLIVKAICWTGSW